MAKDYEALLRAAIAPKPYEPDYNKGFTLGEWGRYFGITRQTVKRRIQSKSGEWVEQMGKRAYPKNQTAVFRPAEGWDQTMIDMVLAKIGDT